jgi:hypothetical protein
VLKGWPAPCLDPLERAGFQADPLYRPPRQREDRAAKDYDLEILVACSQAQQTLGEQFAHGVFNKERMTRVVKAAGQGARDPQTRIDLTQEQHPSIAAEIACRKVGHYLARTQIVKTEEQVLRTDRGVGKRI